MIPLFNNFGGAGGKRKFQSQMVQKLKTVECLFLQPALLLAVSEPWALTSELFYSEDYQGPILPPMAANIWGGEWVWGGALIFISKINRRNPHRCLQGVKQNLGT